MPQTPSARRVRFGEFTADLASQELFRAGTPVRLPNQSFVALAALLERPGELVSRDELRARVWPDNRVVEFEQGLNAVINRLREALGDNAEDPKYVETLPRRGYRFVGALEAEATATHDLAAESLAPGSLQAQRGFPWLMTLAIVFLGVAAGVAFWRLRPPPEPEVAVVTPLTSLVGEERSPALSPDGGRIAYAWNGESPDLPGFDLYVKPVGSERHTRLTHSPAIAVSAAWSPDGTELAFARSSASDGGVFLIAATGGTERKLVDAAFAQESLSKPAWSPDGKTLAYSAIDASSSQTLRLLAMDSLESRPLANTPSCWHAGAPAWSPDGKQLAFICMTSIAVYGVYITEPATVATPRLLARLQGFPQGLVWATEQERLLVANDSGDGGGVWELDLDGTLQRPQIAEEAIASGVSAAPGRIAYSRARQMIDIWRVAVEPRVSRTKRWIFSTREQLTPQFSPDEARIAFQSNRSGSHEIWIADADGGNAVRLTTINGPLTGAPAWCSDGRRLAFDSRESGVSAIYVVDTLERIPRRVETPQSNLALPVWSDDCRWLLASDGRATLYRVPAQGGEAQRFTEQRSYQAAVVGEHVVFNVAEPGGVVLWIKPLEGGAESPVPGMPRLAYADSWTANAEAIYFTDTSRRPVVIRRFDLASGVIFNAATLPNVPTPLGGLGLDVARDGRTLLYTHPEDTQSDLVLVTAGPP